MYCFGVVVQTDSVKNFIASMLSISDIRQRDLILVVLWKNNDHPPSKIVEFTVTVTVIEECKVCSVITIEPQVEWWRALGPSHVKINADAAWDASTRTTGLGCIARDEDNMVLGKMAMKAFYSFDSTWAEARMTALR
ncbi:hypothetical protein ERO13_D08G168601v2 [Gossypium hirsutum]|nr:hypothetical protein ERO13_D08G168601v2 [Gossypium hirsutum]